MDDTGFTGDIAAIYERSLVPFLFTPWAELLAARVAALHPARILETAAGTGALTRVLAARCPDARIVATDLNPAMLDIARAHLPRSVELQEADALALPFDDTNFDVVVSQFGIMFYPDRIAGYREARRVLAPHGTMIAAVWGSLAANPMTKAVQDAVAAAFPADPPQFLARTPFSYADPSLIIEEAEAGGFDMVSVEELTLPHPALDPREAAEGMCLGSPMRAELEERGPGATDRAVAAAMAAMAAFTGPDGKIDAAMTALVITASA